MPVPDVLPAVAAALEQHFGRTPGRASVSFVGVEPVDVLRFEADPGELVYVSLGMARRPMTPAAETVQHTEGPRAELLLQLRDPRGAYTDVWRSLAVLAAAPAVEGVVYAPGMSVDLGSPLAPGARCTGVLVTESSVPPIHTAAGPVDVLQVVPATAAELAWCRVRGGAALQDRWRAAAIDLRDPARSGVTLG